MNNDDDEIDNVTVLGFLWLEKNYLKKSSSSFCLCAYYLIRNMTNAVGHSGKKFNYVYKVLIPQMKLSGIY